MLKIKKRSGEEVAFNPQKIYQRIKRSSKNLKVNADQIFINVITSVPTEGTVTTKQLDKLIYELAASYTGSHYDYSRLASQVAISSYHKESNQSFSETMKSLNDVGIINDKLIEIINQYGPDIIDNEIIHENDYKFDYFGWRSLYEMYLLKNSEGLTVERPQHMYMRVALWITNSFEEAIEYYKSLSEQRISPATPIMINSGTKTPQLASCVLHYNDGDSREGLLNTLRDISVYSADAAGIGLNMTNIRSKESKLSSSGGNAGGLLKYLKIVNESLRFFNQQGRRPGAAAIYIEPWHKDIFDLLDIRKNTGIDEQRARDLFTALWVPDNFMNAVLNDSDWYLFCPNDILKSGLKPLQESYGTEYEEIYQKAVDLGIGKKIKAQELWNKIIESQIETGVPYLLSKDSSNRKTNHKNIGTIRQSNLCAEIIQFSDESNTSICSLSSMVIKNFIINGKFDFYELHSEVRKVVRALNKVIDINNYSTEKGRKGGLEQRAIAIGVQGLADVFFILDYVFTSPEAIDLNKKIFETIYHAAMMESMTLCKNGQYKPYSYYEGSPISEGIFQFDMWGVDETTLMWDWESLRTEIKQYGVCNSLTTAQMPVACQTKDTNIITIDGIKSFEDICVLNDINIDEIEKNNLGGVWYDFKSPLMVKTMGGYEESNRIYYNGHTEIYEIEMEDGNIFKCSSEHQFLVNVNGEEVWVKVKDLKENDDIVNIFKNIKIKSIKRGEKLPVWDIEVDNVHHYILDNGCVSHNSSAKITGSFEMTEPAHSALFNRKVVGGEILIVNKYLINDFEKLGIWGDDLKNEIIINDGSIQNINFNNYLDQDDKKYNSKISRIEHLIKKYKTIWEISQKQLIDMSADRAPFIDQSQSLNIYMSKPTLSRLSSSHFHAWESGLKTLCYYVKTQSISTGAKHLGIDVSKVNEKPLITQIIPEIPSGDWEINCFGCSS
jgi:ribonucleoside-diphosphate reductase alpha subunit